MKSEGIIGLFTL